MRDRYKSLGNSYSTVGIEIVLSVAFGFFGGRWLDDKLHTAPVLMVLGFFFGIGAAIKAVMRASKEMSAIAEREEREQGNPAPLFEDKKRDDDRDDRTSEGSPSDRASPTPREPEDRS